MLIIRQHRIYRKDLRANPSILYIFGDNLERTGFGGQAAEMRGEPNAFGIATKRSPFHGEDRHYFHDGGAGPMQTIDQEFECLRAYLLNNAHFLNQQIIIIPLDGIGTGLSELPKRAPKLLEYINTKLKELELL